MHRSRRVQAIYAPCHGAVTGVRTERGQAGDTPGTRQPSAQTIGLAAVNARRVPRLVCRFTVTYTQTQHTQQSTASTSAHRCTTDVFCANSGRQPPNASEAKLNATERLHRAMPRAIVAGECLH